MSAPPAVSVVIPVLNAAAYLPELLPAIFNQDPCGPDEVVLVDSMSTDGTRAIAERFDRVRVIPIADFSHGRARNLGAREARGDLVVLLTQDALPANRHWLARLVRPFEDPKVAAAFSRQEPRPDANPMERFFLGKRFPDGKPVRRAALKDRPMGLEDVFFSNVSAAIRRSVLMRHPFDETLIMSEDQRFALDVLRAGYETVYQPDSVVIHSHRYSLGHAFRRYFDSVYSLTTIFDEHALGASASMGARYVREEVVFILRRYPHWLPYYALYTCAKTVGALAAHAAGRMPRPLLRLCSLHAYHWADRRPGRPRGS